MKISFFQSFLKGKKILFPFLLGLHHSLGRISIIIQATICFATFIFSFCCCLHRTLRSRYWGQDNVPSRTERDARRVKWNCFECGRWWEVVDELARFERSSEVDEEKSIKATKGKLNANWVLTLAFSPKLQVVQLNSPTCSDACRIRADVLACCAHGRIVIKSCQWNATVDGCGREEGEGERSENVV